MKKYICLIICAAFVSASCSHVMDDFKKSGSSIDTSGVTTSSETQSSEKQLLSFGFTTSANSALSVDVVGTIDQSAHTVAVIVPYGTTVTALVATFTCSDKASVTVGSTAQTSGTTVNNFTSAVTYTVTGEDGSTQTYAVTATVDLFCEKIWNLPSGTDGSAETTGSYVWFGVWPQTIIASSGVTVYESTTTTMGGATYYKGSDGYWYAKVTAEYVSGYTFTNGTEVTSGTDYYFKVEPIKWRVLESGKLLAESILANVCYYGSTLDRTLSSATIYANNYKYSNIRAWLNGTKNQFVTDGGTGGTYDVDWTNKGFLQTAFTEAAQANIKKTNVDNSAASTTDTGNNIIQASSYCCDDTSDKIYLLSELEVTNNTTYHFANYDQNDPEYRTLRRRTVSDYARATGAYMYTSEGDYQYRGIWWLRSPYYSYSHLAHDVDFYGSTKYRYNVDFTDGGVVPALTLAP